MFIVFDTETTGLPKRFNAPVSDVDNWPRCVQIAWQLHHADGSLIRRQDFLIKPEGFDIPFDSEKIHGISTELALEDGVVIQEVLDVFSQDLAQAQFVVGQNIGFDLNIVGCEFFRLGRENVFDAYEILDTCTELTAQLCQIAGGRGGRYKLPTLTELHSFLFQSDFDQAHNATADVVATARCFFELIRRGYFKEELTAVSTNFYDEFLAVNQDVIAPVEFEHQNLKKASKALRKKTQQSGVTPGQSEPGADTGLMDGWPFIHCHNHSQFSILQSTASTQDLISAAIKDNMPGVALTDMGNMMGLFTFYNKLISSINH